MSMLAEPRRRQKIGPNPRGKFFQEEGDNKGRDLLHKLGWKEGDGLGLERQGMTDPIKARSQIDAKGLGYNPLNDPWILHNEEFSQVLSNLNKEHKGGEANADNESKESIKLEKKSKGSKARIHYHKFVKSKDLSKISSKEWSCIFGKHKTDDGNIPVEKQDEDSSLLVKVEVEPVEESSKTINRGSINDYFKIKFEEKLKAIGKSNYLTVKKEDETEELPSFKQTEVELEPSVVVSALEEPQVSSEVPERKKRSKKPKLEEAIVEDAVDEKVLPKVEEEIKSLENGSEVDSDKPPPKMLNGEANEETTFANSPYLRKRFKMLPAQLREVYEGFKGSNLIRLPGYGKF